MKKYRILEMNHKTSKTFSMKVERPPGNLISGQCFNVGIPGMDINREYSMYSDAKAPFLEFLIRAIDDGLVSSCLQKMQVGEQIEIDGPYGEFCIPSDRLSSKFVFISSGTGIAPFHSFIKTYPSIDYTLLHGVRYANETYDSFDYEIDRYIPCISQNFAGDSLRVTDFLKANIVPKDSMIYLCGNRNMIIDSVQILLDQGISGDQIVSEVFF